MIATVNDNRIILWINFLFGLLDKILLRIAIILLVGWWVNELEYALVMPYVADTVPFFFSPDVLETFAFKKPDTIGVIRGDISE